MQTKVQEQVRGHQSTAVSLQPVWTGPRLLRARLPPGPAGALCRHLRLIDRHHLMPDFDVLLFLRCSTEGQVITLDARIPPHSQRKAGALR